MNPNIPLVIVSASGAVVIALVALILNSFWIGSSLKKLDRRITELKQSLNERRALEKKE